MQAVDTAGVAPMAHAQDVYPAPARGRRHRDRPPRRLPDDGAAGRRRPVSGAESDRITVMSQQTITATRATLPRELCRQTAFQPSKTVRPAQSSGPHRRAQSGAQRLHHRRCRKSLAEARAADALRAAGKAGRSPACPIAHKDIFCAKGWLHHLRLENAAQLRRPYDAHVIAKLQGGRHAVIWARPTWTNSPWARRTRPATSAR